MARIVIDKPDTDPVISIDDVKKMRDEIIKNAWNINTYIKCSDANCVFLEDVLTIVDSYIEKAFLEKG